MEEKNQNGQQVQVVQSTELDIIRAKQAAEFALTPVGQQIKQFETQQRMAQMYSTSTIVPDTYKGNLGNCVIALDMSMRMQVNPLMVMQNLYVVHGIPSFSSKFLIATVNACGRFTPLRYEFKGEEGNDNWSCRCYAYESSDKNHKEPLYGDWISIGMAKSEGWYGKQGSKWKTMPGQMLRYRAAAFWQRSYAPEISMGFISTEEAQDIDEQTQVEDQVATEISNNANKEVLNLQPTQQEVSQKQKVVEVEQPVGESSDIPAFMMQ